MLDTFDTSFQDGSDLMSLGPSPAIDVSAIHFRRLAIRNPRPNYSVGIDYMCPQPIRSSSPTLNTSTKRRTRITAAGDRERQASEEISQILRSGSRDNLAAELDIKVLEGSRSADMFVTKRHTSKILPSFATPPLHEITEEQDKSDDDIAEFALVPAVASPTEPPLDINNEELRYALASSPPASHMREASIYDLPVLAQTTFTPPTRAQNPLPMNSPFAVSTEYCREGAEIGILSFSPPATCVDDEIKARRARFTSAANLSSDFRNKVRFGDITPRGAPSSN